LRLVSLPNNTTGADGVKIAVFRKGPASLEFFRAAAHRRTLHATTANDIGNNERLEMNSKAIKAYCHFCGASVGDVSERTGNKAEAIYDCPKCRVNYCSQCSALKNDSVDGAVICLRCNSKMERVV
jgi:Zn finger protein HypA/HybF involved in hydrogenase expression